MTPPSPSVKETHKASVTLQALLEVGESGVVILVSKALISPAIMA